ncbi:MAG: hypothetical protein Q7K40_01260 [bacterium]|nr:hypothetical protein [bacterium]
MKKEGVTRESAKRQVGEGWHGLIDEFYNMFPDAYMTQVKEKFGGLRLYHSGGSDESTKKEIEIMERSEKMCELCGKPTETRDIRGWLWTLCDDHAKLQEDKK